MALAVLTVLATGRTDAEEIGAEMVRWYASGPRDVGGQTRAVLGDAQRHGSSPADAATSFQRRRPDAAGNGALMRTGPVALAALGDRDAVAQLATEVAALTHPHPDSIEACVLWSLAIEQAITTARVGERFDWCAALVAGFDHVDATRHELWRARIAEAADAEPADFQHNNGWVVGAFQAALAAITVDRGRTARAPLRPPHGGAAPGGPRRRRHRHGRRHRRVVARGSVGRHRRAAALGAAGSTADGSTASRRLSPPTSTPWPASPSATGAPTAAAGPAWPTSTTGRCRRCAANSTAPGSATPAASVTPSTRVPRVVVSLCRMGTADVPDDVEHHTVGLIDTTAADNPNAAFVLLDTARTIDELAAAGERVFVHCVRAEHRAPSMAAAYLISRGVDAETAIATRQSGPRRYAAGIPARRTRGDRADCPGRPSSLPVICLAGNDVVSNGYKV